MWYGVECDDPGARGKVPQDYWHGRGFDRNVGPISGVRRGREHGADLREGAAGAQQEQEFDSEGESNPSAAQTPLAAPDSAALPTARKAAAGASEGTIQEYFEASTSDLPRCPVAKQFISVGAQTALGMRHFDPGFNPNLYVEDWLQATSCSSGFSPKGVDLATAEEDSAFYELPKVPVFPLGRSRGDDDYEYEDENKYIGTEDIIEEQRTGFSEQAGKIEVEDNASHELAKVLPVSCSEELGALAEDKIMPAIGDGVRGRSSSTRASTCSAWIRNTTRSRKMTIRCTISLRTAQVPGFTGLPRMILRSCLTLRRPQVSLLRGIRIQRLLTNDFKML